MITRRELLSSLRSFGEVLLGLMVFVMRFVRTHPKITSGMTLLFLLSLLGVWRFGTLTAERAAREEMAFWGKARTLTLEERTMVRNDMVRIGRLPHLLPWWEMDSDRCAAVAWKFVNLLSGVELTHGNNGAAWMLRKQNRGKMKTIWDGTGRFNEEGSLGEELRPTIAEFRQVLERLHPDRLYLAGFRWADTRSAELIRRDKSDINSHIVVVTGDKLFHMFGYGSQNDPIVADFQERFFASEKMQPVWLAEVQKNRKPFQFARTTKSSPLVQNLYPWGDLRVLLRLPDWVPGANAIEKTLLYWVRNGYDMYPRLP